MLENIFFAFVSVFFFIGVMFCIYLLMVHIIRPKNGETSFIVTVFDENEENAVARVGYLLTRTAMWENGKNIKIIAVDNGLSAERYSSLIRTFATEPKVIICPALMLEKILLGKSGETKH